MRLLFFGSASFSLVNLQACLDAGHDVVTVVTTPDQKQGRGLQEQATPVRIFAQEHRLPVIAPPSLKNVNELRDSVAALKPEVLVVASYGKIIPSDWLQLPSRICLNVHPSLLPKHRGAAPIHWPLLLGETQTGISIAEVTPRLDAGDIFFQESSPIVSYEDAVALEARLAKMSSHALVQVLEQLTQGKLQRTPQNESQQTYARKLTKKDSPICWSKTAREVFNQIRGLVPWPTATVTYRGEVAQILAAGEPMMPTDEMRKKVFQPGEMAAIQSGKGLWVVCGDQQWINLVRVKPAGKREMAGWEFANGRRLSPGDRLAGGAEE